MTVKLRFTRQKFQEDAASSVCSVFAGQPSGSDRHIYEHSEPLFTECFTTWVNSQIVLPDSVILDNIRNVQRRNGLPLSESLEGKYNLTVEMETGTGKTYTYIKTIHELYRLYGWSKFVIVVPSIAVREGVYKTFMITQDHFAGEYGTRPDCFIYSSSNLERLNAFVSENSMQIMIINSQAFNARDADTRRIRMDIDSFGGRKPIDVIASVRPVMIIDEPQSVEGAKTKESIRDFNPLFTLRYSATPKERYNLMYRLDALDAYSRRLVKRIRVTGIRVSNAPASGGYVYLKAVIKSEKDPQALVEFDRRTSGGIKRTTVKLREGSDLYGESGGLEEYRGGFSVKTIDGLNGSVEFMNGIKLSEGDITGSDGEEQKRRIQIRETIEAHLEKERELFRKGIKVLSLFFIDEVAKYRLYDDGGHALNGVYARIFEEEYTDAVRNFRHGTGGEEYAAYLGRIRPEDTHAGYFSVDRNNRMTESRINSRKDGTTDDVGAYDLIMRDKERLLSLDEPVRFIFSHSALREGWDNPNVFQICALRNTKGEIRRRQEVGRGLRLCVNQEGERVEGADTDVNELTVIANESYADFAAGLQQEIAGSLGYRPQKITPELFTKSGLDSDSALSVYEQLIRDGYIIHGGLTEKFHDDMKGGALDIPPEAVRVLDTVYRPEGIEIADARNDGVRILLNPDKLEMPEFMELWHRINHYSVYSVDFDDEELARRASSALNDELDIARPAFMVERGMLNQSAAVEELEARQAFTKYASRIHMMANTEGSIRFDVVGSLAGITGLTRRVIVKILKGTDPLKLGMFAANPEMFIARASRIIDGQKADAVVEHISYNMLDDTYKAEIFSDAALKRVSADSLTHKLARCIYDCVSCDSQTEKDFAEELDAYEDVAVYVKLPRAFSIDTPVGKYNPDWAIAFVDGSVKHVYFVAETKGSVSRHQLRGIEQAKTACAVKHFDAVSRKGVKYQVVSSFGELMNLVKG